MIAIHGHRIDPLVNSNLGDPRIHWQSPTFKSGNRSDDPLFRLIDLVLALLLIVLEAQCQQNVRAKEMCVNRDWVSSVAEKKDETPFSTMKLGSDTLDEEQEKAEFFRVTSLDETRQTRKRSFPF